MAGPAPIVVKITGVDRVSQVFGGVSKRVTSFAKQLDGIGRGLRRVGTGLVGVGVGGAFATGLAGVPGQILRIEQALKRLQFTEGFSEAQIKDVAGAIKQISTETLQGQEALIPAIDKIGDAGFNLQETLKIVTQSAKAATAFGKPMETVADAAFTLGTNFKIASGEMDDALDIVAQLATTNIDFDELNELLGKAGTSVKAIGAGGISGLRQVAAALQVVRTQTGSSSQAAKTLAKLYESITDPMILKKFKDQVAGPGIDVVNRLEMATTRGEDTFKAYLGIVKEAITQGNPSLIKQQERLAELFGESDIKAVRALIDQIDKYDAAIEASGKSQGTIQKGLQAQLDTTLGQWQLFRRSIETTDIKPLSSAFKFLNLQLKEFNKGGENASLVVNGLVSAIVAGGALIALGQLSFALKNVGGALLFISKALPVVASAISAHPLLALAVALAGIGAFAFSQAKKAAAEAGTEGLQKGSEARRLLDKAGTEADPIAKKVAALHEQAGNFNPFAHIPAPKAAESRAGDLRQMEATLTVDLNNVPPGTRVKTRADKNVSINTNMGLAFPR